MKLPTLTLAAWALVLGAAPPALGQQPPPVLDRFGLAANPETYPQSTPKEALASAVRALEKDRVEYFAAHLLDPAFVDARISDRAAALEVGVERDLLQLRDRQRGTSAGPNRVPYDPTEFAAVVTAEARRRAFRRLVQDVRTTLAESPDHLRDLRRFEAGEFADGGETAKATLLDVKDRAVFFRLANGRWFVLDRKAELPAAPEK